MLIIFPVVAVDEVQVTQKSIEIPIALFSQAREEHVPISLLDPIIDDSGLAGAEQGIRDNNTTGRFTGQKFRITFHQVNAEDSPVDRFRQQYALGIRLFLLDLPAATILELADLPEAGGSLLFNIGARDDSLRTHACRENLLHTAPSRAMLADALAQYLAWKRWNRWFLVVGRHAEDQAFAEALKRAAARFGGKLVEEKAWTFKAGARRTDSGHTQAQQEVNAFTQVRDYDILLVADEREEFGEYLSYRTYLPRPVGGTQGLAPRAWSRVHEQWGATQFQNRFHRTSGRWMSELDYAAWIAVRSIGEGATRVRSGDPAVLRSYLMGPEFKLAAFKGSAVTYRDWNGQLRQPLLITSPRVLISVSPQKGFLHQFSMLDTLGFDRSETRCR
ncbi:MAG: ABC transporter substrate-binding protein [Gammaproteobacteria bacterium]|nr:ABC transporter substrate-binding protein [Gammaproteobacteria bacterium]